jgi:CobW/HypB/UreG, nucleotide-binding domain
VGRIHVHADGKAHEHEHHEGSGHLPDDDGGHREVGDHSGYAATGTVRVEVLEHILSENDRVAAANRRDFASAGVISVNLMSSPGAGKTTLLKRTLTRIGGTRRVGILEGDIATSLDAGELGAELRVVGRGDMLRGQRVRAGDEAAVARRGRAGAGERADEHGGDHCGRADRGAARAGGEIPDRWGPVCGEAVGHGRSFFLPGSR